MSTKPRIRILLALPFLALLTLGARRGRAVELELTYLANEGFLLRAGDESLLIDAFITEPLGNYLAVPKELFAEVVDGRPPFDGVDLALASHYHTDHFQAKPAAEYAQAHPDVPIVSSPQVLALLRTELGEKSERLKELLPEERKSVATAAGKITLELLRLPHTGGAQNRDVQNLGHVLDFAGLRVLHVGDADVGTEDLRSYELAKRAIDVALVPYWWLGDAKDLERVKALIGAKHLVAMHVPSTEMSSVKEGLAKLDPDILVFEEPGEAHTLALEARK